MSSIALMLMFPGAISFVSNSRPTSFTLMNHSLRHSLVLHDLGAFASGGFLADVQAGIGCESILVAVDVVICQSGHVAAEFLGVQEGARGGVRGTHTDESGDEAGDDRGKGERGGSSDRVVHGR